MNLHQYTIPTYSSTHKNYYDTQNELLQKIAAIFFLQTSNEFQHHHGMYLLRVAFFNELCIFALLNKWFFLGFVFFSIVYRITSFSLHQLYSAGSVPLIDLPISTVLTHQRFYDTLWYLCSKEIIYITRVISLVHLSLVNIYRNTDSNYLLLDI